MNSLRYFILINKQQIVPPFCGYNDYLAPLVIGVQCESSAFAEFKRVWLSRRFSYIFEAAPSTNQGLFMQSLFAHSISKLSPLSLVFHISTVDLVKL